MTRINADLTADVHRRMLAQPVTPQPSDHVIDSMQQIMPKYVDEVADTMCRRVTYLFPKSIKDMCHSEEFRQFKEELKTEIQQDDWFVEDRKLPLDKRYKL